MRTSHPQCATMPSKTALLVAVGRTLTLGLDARVSAAPAAYTGCAGKWGRVPAEIWQQVKDTQGLNVAARELGSTLDQRSDSLDEFREILEDKVMGDIEGAVQDCVFGVVSMVLLALPLVEARKGTKRAQELLALADQLFYQSSELVEKSGWALDPDTYHVYRQLLGNPISDCAGSALRVYVYNSTAHLSQQYLNTGFGMMGAAAHMHAYLRSSSCLTDDPDEADLFFSPAHHGEQYSEFIEEYIHSSNLADRFPFLARRRGADHVFVVGANLPSWENLAPLRHSILLTVESYQVNNDIPRWYSPWKDVMIPGYIDRYRIAAMRANNKPTSERGYILAFHGNHPGTHALYVKFNASVRSRILDSFTGIPDCSVGGHTPEFFARMGRSHFCLVPRGSSAWTIHLYESFFFGCIPVILSDELEVPFQDIVDWPSFSLKWPENKVGPELLSHLRAIPLLAIEKMQRNLEDAACWFDFHRGWGVGPQGDETNWSLRGNDVVALGSDCSYLGHGNGETLQSCRHSCDQDGTCNLVNYRPSAYGDCVMRSCTDPAQPTLTSQAVGYSVWAKVDKQSHECSPYAAIFRSLETRVKRRPITHGPFWS